MKYFKNKKEKNRLLWLFLFSVFLFLGIVLFSFVNKNILRVNKVARYTKRELANLTISDAKILNQIVNNCMNQDSINWESLFRHYSEHPKNLFVFHDDSLLFWNTYKISGNKISKVSSGRNNTGVFKSGKQWFFFSKKIYGQNTYILCHPIYPWLSGKNGPFIFVKATPDLKRNEIVNFENHSLRIERIDTTLPNEQSLTIIIELVFFLAYFFFLEALFLLYIQVVQFAKFKGTVCMVFIVGLILLRLFDYYFYFPQSIKTLSIFQNTITQIFLFKSLGDILLNLFLIYFIIKIVLFIKNKYHLFTKNSLIIISLFAPFLILFLFYLLDITLELNGFDILFQLNQLSHNALFVLFFILFTNYLVYQIVTLTVSENANDNNNLIIKTISSVLLVLVGLYFSIEKELIFLTVGTYFAYAIILYFNKKNKNQKLISVFFVAFFMAFSGFYLLNVTDNQRLDKTQLFTADYLAQNEDPLFEFQARKILPAIANDSFILRQVKLNEDSNDIEGVLKRYLTNKYFKKFKSIYNIQLTFCKENQMLEIQPEGKYVGCSEFFATIPGKVIFNDSLVNLRLLNGEIKNIYYIADIMLKNSKNGISNPHLIIEFLNERIPSGVGYTSSIEDNRLNEIHLDRFNFARYSGNVLEYKFGKFPYPTLYHGFEAFPSRKFFRWNNYIHYILPLNKHEYLVVSRKQKHFAFVLLPFTLLFLIELLLFFPLSNIKSFKSKSIFNYSYKIQVIYFVSFITIFGLLASVSIYYMNLGNNNAIESELEEKTHSISEELQHKIMLEPDIQYDSVALETYLKKLSTIYFTDINFYNRKGYLIVSSRPTIFSKNFQSLRMNPVAFNALKYRHKLFSMVKEKIRNTNFYSSYLPMVLENGMQVGYLNLPYFAKENELIKSRNLLFVSFFNLLVFLAILLVFISYFVTKMITKPLNLLKLRMKETHKETDLVEISWNRDDEIGQLVSAYNQMVEKLKERTLLLKKTERESAWREMAQQIAHEIRNPLTPMKLNIQYLIKSRKEEDPEFDKKLINISDTLITQIEALNNVASMFSDFSKGKSKIIHVFDLQNVLTRTVSLFRTKPSVTIRTLWDVNKKFYVKGDEHDFIRIFNNLIKNAIQSFEKKRVGEILIKMVQTTDTVRITISDNGPGISNEMKKKIFEPYFTTKSKGTGIGLAIVYNLVKDLKGDINFESEKGKGTRFFIQFPKAKEPEE